MKYVSYLIKVTKDHLERGKKGNACYCPVAIALQEFFGVKIYVSHQAVGFPNLPLPNISLPPECRNFVRKFDKEEPVEPFDFYFTISEKTKDAIDSASVL